MKFKKWFCKKFGHSRFTSIDQILIGIALLHIENFGETDISLICSRCKQKFSVQKIYNLTHDGVERTIDEIIKLSEVE